MDITIMLQGMVVGFSIAAPVGAIGLLCIQNSLQHGMLFGLSCGLGAATADMMYGILVAVGMQPLATFLLNIKTPLAIIGSLFLIYLGIKKFWAKPVMKAARIDSTALFGAYVSTFFLTLVNPATILDFMALFVSFRIDVAYYLQGIYFVTGVFLGSAFWWCLLSASVGIFRKHISEQIIMLINYAAGLLICSFGFWTLLKTLS